jgi:GT2 family glycosyltransferase
VRHTIRSGWAGPLFASQIEATSKHMTMTKPAPARDAPATVVTVTYGQRWELLRQALASARQEGVARAVVVDNGAKTDVGQLATAEFGPDFVDVVRLGRNMGSAAGFKAGIERALTLGSEFILLLDDDNMLAPGAVATLREAWAQESAKMPADALAMLAFRADRMTDAATLVPAGGMRNTQSAFFGFRCADIPFKIAKRIPLVRKRLARLPVQSQVVMSIAPYSGMYFHRSMVIKHGAPDERFVLYADDTEFSYRLTRAGGKIVLVTGASITDLEPSWSGKGRFGNSFDTLLCSGDDFRAFYSTRNNAYYERWSREGGNALARKINRLIFLTILRTRARALRKQQRLALLRQAIAEGEAGRLGVSEAFPLA